MTLSSPNFGTILLWDRWSCERQARKLHPWMAQASRIANYWRRHFGVPEEQEPEPHQNETPPQEHQDHETTAVDDTSTEAQPPQQTPAHIQVNQLAWLLHDILAQAPDFNAPVLQALQSAESSSSSTDPSTLLTREGLAHLSGHLAIFSNMMAQSY